MTHPTREEWMSYLYDDAPSSTKATLAQHLETCPACQKSVDEWQSVKQSLDSWKLPKRSLSVQFFQPVLKWGMAAAFAVGLGYGLGRFSVPAASVETLRAGIENSLRASIETEVQSRLVQKLGAEFKVLLVTAQTQLIDRMDTLAAKTLTESSDQTQGLLIGYTEAIKNLDARLTRQGTDIRALRNDTETVAVLTEAGFRRSEQQLVHLANLSDFQGPSAIRPSGHENP